MVKIKTIFMFVYVEFVSFLFAFMPPKLLRIVTRDRVTIFENNAFQQAEKRPLSTNLPSTNVPLSIKYNYLLW
jgi:hypothetical protein